MRRLSSRQLLFARVLLRVRRFHARVSGVSPAFRFAALAAFFLLAACGRKTEPPSKIRLALDWYPEPEHGGYLQAFAKGYYADAGLDVEILSGTPRLTAERRVAGGEADLGLSSSDQTLVARERGLPLVALTTTLQHDPLCIMVHAESPVKTFADLSGRRVAVSPGFLWFQYLVTHFKLYDIEEVPPTYSIATFLHDPDYIQQAFVTSEPYFARQGGAETRTLLVRDAGYDDYRVLVGRRDFVTAHPEEMRRFVAASLRGWRDFLDSPDPGLAEILKRNPETNAALARNGWQVLKEGRFVEGFSERGEAIGQMTEARWREQADMLKEIGALPSIADPTGAYTNDFQPK